MWALRFRACDLRFGFPGLACSGFTLDVLCWSASLRIAGVQDEAFEVVEAFRAQGSGYRASHLGYSWAVIRFWSWKRTPTYNLIRLKGRACRPGGLWGSQG